MIVLSYHSLEDRLVKHAFQRLAHEGFEIRTKKVIQPGEAEIASNPRARSAKMRVLEKVATATRTGGEDAAPQAWS